MCIHERHQLEIIETSVSLLIMAAVVLHASCALLHGHRIHLPESTGDQGAAKRYQNQGASGGWLL